MAQRLLDSAAWTARNQIPVAGRSQEKQHCLELEKHCANSVAGASPLKNLSNTSPLKLPGVASSPHSRGRSRILLIDDEYLEIMFLAGTLEENYEIIFALDSVTALETAGRNMPDLILLDVMMPGIDGFEVCRRLKADSRTKEIPVIFITGRREEAAETKGLELGAVDYITKPFQPAQLRVGVNMHIKRRWSSKDKSS
jgi:CheY-like chemotaxis protein